MSKEIELVDLVDHSGKIKKVGVPRHEADQHKDLCLQIAIAVIFDKSQRVLVERRALTKSTEPGLVDHVCGAISTGETPEQAIARESLEETGIIPKNIRVISKGLNVYNRYKYLLIGEAQDGAQIVCSDESEWVRFMSTEDLKAKEISGELKFVKDFFENNELALKLINQG
jgi:8-oxo-dGTP pyrophosphatase MutT (NUDIX family)